MKTKKKPNTPGRIGRPRKNGVARKEVSVCLSPATVRELDDYVKALRKEAPGSSRGDVITAALESFGPLRLWRSTLGRKTAFTYSGA